MALCLGNSGRAGPEQRKPILVMGDWTSDHPALSLCAARGGFDQRGSPKVAASAMSEGKPPPSGVG